MESLIVIPFVNQTLGNSSYLVGSKATGRAAVVDPERDVEKYIRAADEQGLQIVYGLETHLHADFISGVHELAHALALQDKDDGYQIAVSAGANAAFKHVALHEGDELSLGDLSLRVLATPGHSREHISFLVVSEQQPDPVALFSGGSLIVGGTGRTDLHGAKATEPLAHALFHTIQGKLSGLPDSLAVYPTHGAGSFCNTVTGAERTSTIATERATNPFFKLTDEEEFVDKALDGLGSFPEYYKRLPAVNREGAPVLGEVPKLKALSPTELQKEVDAGAVVIDVRDADRFLSKHIPKSYGIPVFAPLSTWAGWVVPEGSAIVLVSDAPSELQEAVLQLIRVGYDDLHGYLDGGIATWEKAGLPLNSVKNVAAPELKTWLDEDKAPPILDVRLQHEWNSGHLPGAKHLEAGLLQFAAPKQIGEKDAPLLVHCKAGTRSTVAVSLLEQKGFHNLLALDEGIEAWKHAGYGIVND
jgi:hydroxyacylglutathione hydrolase